MYLTYLICLMLMSGFTSKYNRKRLYECLVLKTFKRAVIFHSCSCILRLRISLFSTEFSLYSMKKFKKFVCRDYLSTFIIWVWIKHLFVCGRLQEHDLMWLEKTISYSNCFNFPMFDLFIEININKTFYLVWY